MFNWLKNKTKGEYMSKETKKEDLNQEETKQEEKKIDNRKKVKLFFEKEGSFRSMGYNFIEDGEYPVRQADANYFLKNFSTYFKEIK